MRICIDCRMIGPHLHGIARYALNLVRGFAELNKDNSYFLLVSSPTRADLFPKQENFVLQVLDAPLYAFGEQLLLPRILRRMQVDLFHSPTFSAPVLLCCPTIMTIHDLIHLIFPCNYSLFHRAYYRLVVKTAARRSKKLLTISEASKGDLIRYLGLPEKKVSVIPNGVDPGCQPILDQDAVRKSLKSKWGITETFLLWVGNPKPHKNVGGVLRAFQTFVARDSRTTGMVVVGVSHDEALAKLSDSRLLEGVIFIPWIKDQDLWELYSGAALFVYPSLYEGFGFPPLEAMACGCPVITSNVSSLPEVVGDAAILVDPNDIEGMAGAIKRVLTDRQLRQEMQRKGLEQAKLFSWQETAAKTLKVYEEVYAQG